MNKISRTLLIAGLSLFGIAGASFGLGYASWVYSDGGVAAQSANVAALVGKWTYINGFFYLMNSDGTVDWSTKITPAVYDPNPSNANHVYHVENPSGTKVCAYFPYAYTPEGGTTSTNFTGTDKYATDTNLFANSVDVQQVYLPNSYDTIGEYTFTQATSLASVHFYDATSGGATAATSLTVGQYAFYGASSLTSFDFPSIPTTLDSGAFYYANLQSADLSHVTSIGMAAMASNTNLTSVTLSENLTTLETYAFWGDSALTSLTIPSAITTIPQDVCNGCHALSSLTFNGDITLVDDGAFYADESLIHVSLPVSLTSIGNRSFALTSTQKKEPLFVDYAGTRAQWNAITKNSKWKENRTLYLRCLGEKKDISSPATTILDYLSNNTDNAGTNSGYTVDVTCSDGVIHFMDSSNQYTVDMASNAATVSAWSPYSSNTNLVGIKLNANNSSLPTGAFYGDSNLSYVDFSAANNLAIGTQAFRACTSLTSFVPGVNVSSIGDEAFEYCTSLTKLDIASTSTMSIGKQAFVSCSGLADVNISAAGALTMADGAFYGDTALATLSLHSGSTMGLGNYAFEYCTALANLDIESVGKCTLGSSCFAEDSALVTADFSKAAKLVIGGSCFADDNALTTLKVPADLTSIASWSLSVGNSYTGVILTIYYPGTSTAFKAIVPSASSLSNRSTIKVICAGDNVTLTYNQ